MNTPQRSSVIGEIRALYEALQRFDVLASDALGLNVSDLRCVNILKDGPLSPGEIGRRVGLTSGSVTAMIDRLERRGIVARQKVPNDRRSMRIALAQDVHERAGAVYSVLGHALGDSLNQAGYGRSPLTAALLAAMIEGIQHANDRLVDAAQAGRANDNADTAPVAGKIVAG